MPTAFAFTEEQLAEIERLRNILAQDENATVLGAAVDLYSYIFKCVTGAEVPEPATTDFLKDLMDQASWDALPEDQKNSALWLYGAIQVNSSHGAFSMVIRQYNVRQGQLRGIGTFDDDQLQAASNAVGLNLASTILDPLDTLGQPNENQGHLPTVQDIGVNDLLGVRDKLYPGNETEGSELFLNQAWPGIVMLGALGGQYTDRLLRYQEDGAHPVALDQLGDLKSLLFCWDSFRSAFQTTWEQTFSVTAMSDVLIGMNLLPTVITNALDALAQYGLTSFAQIVFSALVQPQNDEARDALNVIAQLGSQKFLDMVKGARTGQLLVGTTTEGGFVADASAFFNGFSVAELQSLKATTLGDASSIATLAETDVSVRAALAALSVVSVQVSAEVAEKFRLYDDATGEGQITEQWIEDRSKVLAAFRVYWERGETDGVLSVTDGSLLNIPFAQWGDTQIVVEGATSSTQQLVVDGFDSIVTPTMLRYFGNDDANNRSGGSADDHLFGGGGNDTLAGLGDDDYIEGDEGDDDLDGGDGADVLLGGAGADTLNGGAGDDQLSGGLGDDHYEIAEDSGFDVITSSDAGDRLVLADRVLNGAGDVQTNSDTAVVWTDESVADQVIIYLYDKSARELTVSGAGSTVVIKDFQSGDLGIAVPTGDAPAPPGTDFVGDFEKKYDPTSKDYEFDAHGNYVSSGAQAPGAPDLYTGTAADEVILGLAGHDALLGRAGDDWVEGGDGNDVVMGGTGKDTLIGGDGSDAIYGSSSGNYYYPQKTTETLPTTSNPDGWNGFGWYGYPDAEQVEGGAYLSNPEGRDTQPDDGDSVIDAGAGNDGVLAGTGNDLADAGSGDDFVAGMAGSDTLLGGEGGDFIEGDGTAEVIPGLLTVTASSDQAADLINGGDGNDTLIGQGGADELYGDGGDDDMSGDGRTFDETPADAVASDYLDGGAGRDSISGGGAGDTLYGGDDADVMWGDERDGSVGVNDGDDFMNGDAGDDALAGQGGEDVLDGGDGADYLSGDGGDGAVTASDGGDDLSGGQGDDVLVGQGGDDWLDGGDGADALLGDAATGSDGSSDGSDVLDGGGGDDALAGQGGADWLFGGAGKDQIWGGGGDDYLDGEEDADVLIGGEGDDTLVGEGADYLDGGEGDDTYIIDGIETRDVDGHEVASIGYIDDAEGDNQIVVEEMWDTSIDVFSYAGQQYVQLGGTGGALVALGNKAALSSLLVKQSDGSLINLQSTVNSTSEHGLAKSADWSLSGGVVDTATIATDQFLEGSERSEWVAGGLGSDCINAHAGNDWVSGGIGADFLDGGAGADTIEGGVGGDTFNDDGAQGDVFLFSRGDGSDTLKYAGAAASAADRDVIRFGDGITADDIQAFNLMAVRQDGSFQLLLVYGDGDEILVDEGGEGNISRLEFADGTTMSIADVVAKARAAEGGDGSGAGADTGTMVGTAADDLLVGDASFNTIKALAGDDTVEGGGGYDILIGGAGKNTYRFGAGSGSDRIEASSGEVGTLQFESVGLGSLTAWVDGSDLIIAAGPGQTVRLAGFSDETMAERYAGWQVGADGQSMSLAALANATAGTTASSSDQRMADFIDAAMHSLHNSSQTEFVGAGGGRYWVRPSVSVQSKSGSNLTFEDYLSLEVKDTQTTYSYQSPIYRSVTVTHSATVEDEGMWVSPVTAGYGSGGGQDGGGSGTQYWVTTRSHVETWETTEEYVVGWTRSTVTVTTVGNAVANADFLQVTGTAGADSFISSGIGSSSPGLFRGTIESGAGDDEIRLATGHLSSDIGVMTRFDDWATLEAESPSQWEGYVGFPYAANEYTPRLMEPDYGNLGYPDTDGPLAFRDHGVGAWIDAGAGDDTVSGTDADDVIIGGAGNDWMDGQAGADTYVIANDGGVDRIADLAVLSDSDLAALGAWNDLYWSDLLLGYDDAGPIYGHNFRMAVRNEDIVEFDSTVTLSKLGYRWGDSAEGSGYRTLHLFADGIEFLQVEYATGATDAGVEMFKFSDGSSKTLDGLLGSIPLLEDLPVDGTLYDETLVGGSGNDTLRGYGGDDVLNGGSGNDTYVYQTGDGHDTVVDAGGSDVLKLVDVASLNGVAARRASNAGGNGLFVALLDQEGNETTSGVWVPVDDAGNPVIETVAFSDGSTAAFNDLLITQQSWTGTGSPDTWTGDRHDDIASGGLGGDTLHGATGNDALNGDSGNDKLFGDGGHDQLYGGLGTDTLRGGAGNDTLDGGTGGDTMAGDAGDDIYFVDSAQDSVSENTGEGWDAVSASISYTLLANQEALTLTGSSDLAGTGNGLDNLLTGNSGANQLTGYAGNDTFDGAAGNDTLVGGGGADTYRFGAGSGNDAILDTDATASVLDRVEFGSGINSGDVSFTKQGSDLLVRVNGLSDTLLVTNWYLNSKYHVEQFAFADGTVLSDGQIGLQVGAATDSAIERRSALAAEADDGWASIRGRLLIQAMAQFQGGHGGFIMDTSVHALQWRGWDALTMPAALA